MYTIIYMYLIYLIHIFMTAVKNIAAKVKAFDQKHTNFHSATYWLLFITAAFQVLVLQTQAASAFM